MEIDITKFFRDAYHPDYSASVFERGEHVAKETWYAAIDAAGEFMMIDTEEKRAAFRKYALGFGAWEKNEIYAWSDAELNALFIQMVAGDIRESGIDTMEPDWEEYANDDNAGRFGPADDGSVYYYIGD